ISELDPNSINVHVKLADLYSQNNQTSDALKEYDRVGRMLLKRGMLDEAVQVFRKALKIDATNVDLVDSLITALVEARDFDNAMQIVSTSLQSNSGNARLLALQGRIFLAKGDAQSARKALERGLASNPDEPAIRESLADLYLKVADPDRALSMVAPLAEKAIARGERGAAVELFNRILRVDSTHTPTLEHLVALYSRLNEETNILASMNSLAEANMGKGNYQEAAQVLDKLIEREPQNAQHRNKLQFVKSQMGGIDTIPAHQKSAQEPPPKTAPSRPVSLEIEEPGPSFGLDEDAEISLGMDDSPGIEFELESPPPPVAPPPAKARPLETRSTHLAPAVEIAAAELAGEAGDDLDFITEHLTEAEVFAKYGLAEKAIEHLRAVIDRSPNHVVAHDRLYRLLLDEGETEAAKASANHYIAILEQTADVVSIDAVRHEFTSRGQTLAAARAVTVERPAPPAAPIEEEIEELSFDLDATEGPVEMLVDEDVELGAGETVSPLDFSIHETAADSVPELVPDEEFVSELEPPLSIDPEPELTLGQELEPELVLEPEPLLESEPVLEPEPEPLMESEPELTLGDESELTLEPELEPLELDEELAPLSSAFPAEEEIASPAPAEEEVFFGSEALPVEPAIAEPAVEEIGEIDFYIEQELFDEARKKVESLLARYPDNFELTSRAATIKASAAPAPTASAPARPAALSRDEIESELLSAIPDDDDDLVIP
ncbi:MAG: tetratricopeptide repeat protein, partial [Acidobacteriota bacterium]